MKTIELHLKAVDFKGTDFYSPYECAISKAAARQLCAKEIRENGPGLNIDESYYHHDWYWWNQFDSDRDLATSADFDNTTIRTITLTKAN